MEAFLSYVATIWFFVILNSYLVWNSLAPVIHFLPALFIVTGTITISHKLSLSKHNIIIGYRFFSFGLSFRYVIILHQL